MSAHPVANRVDLLLDAWNSGDLDAFTARLTDDVWWHDLGMWSPPAVGRAAVRAFAESVLRAFPDFRYTVRAPICIAEDERSCVVPFTVTATNLGVLDPPGLAPANAAVRFDGLDYLTFRGDLVCRIETRFDPAEPIRQMLGLRIRPSPGSLAERLLVTLQRLAAARARQRGRRG